MICGSGGSKSTLAIAAGAEPSGRMKHEKLHAVWGEAHGKMARRYGAKHISKSKCPKHTRFGPLLEVQMLKNGMVLWCEAHFEVKMSKT